MRVLRDRVLIEETYTKVTSPIIMIDTKKKDDYYTIVRKVIGVGPEVKEVKLGDDVVLVSYCNPEAENVISGKTGDDVIVRTVVVSETDIIAVKEEKK